MSIYLVRFFNLVMFGKSKVLVETWAFHCYFCKGVKLCCKKLFTSTSTLCGGVKFCSTITPMPFERVKFYSSLLHLHHAKG